MVNLQNLARLENLVADKVLSERDVLRKLKQSAEGTRNACAYKQFISYTGSVYEITSGERVKSWPRAEDLGVVVGAYNPEPFLTEITDKKFLRWFFYGDSSNFHVTTVQEALPKEFPWVDNNQHRPQLTKQQQKFLPIAVEHFSYSSVEELEGFPTPGIIVTRSSDSYHATKMLRFTLYLERAHRNAEYIRRENTRRSWANALSPADFAD